MGQEFHYKAIDSTGRDVEGQISETSESAAVANLTMRGYAVYWIGPVSEKQKAPWYRKDIKFGQNISDQDIADFSRILARLLNSGIRITDALSIVAENVRGKSLSAQADRIRRDIENGEDPSAAFAGGLSAFPKDYRALIGAGLASNRLATTLVLAERLYQARSESRQKILGAILYPILLSIGAVLVAGIVLFYLVPTLQDALAGTPTLQEGGLARLYSVSQFLKTNAAILCLGVSGALLALWSLRSSFLALLTRWVPSARRALQNPEWARSARILGIFLQVGQTLDKALDEMIALENNPKKKATLRSISDALKRGVPAGQSLPETIDIHPLFERMFRLGAETNEMPAMMELVADSLEQFHRQNVQRLTQLLSPMLTLLIGGIIAFLVYTIIGTVLDVSQVAV